MRKLFKLNRAEKAVIEAVGRMGSFNRLNFTVVGKKESLKPVNKDGEDACAYYEFIPNVSSHVMHDLYQVSKYLESTKFKNSNRFIKFLDVGSGLGNILALADLVHFTVQGIEYDKEYAKVSSWPVKDRTTYVDALKYKEYANYDVIYFYQPIYTSSIMCELLDIIDSQIKKGTILMCYTADGHTKDHVNKIWPNRVFRNNTYIRKK